MDPSETEVAEVAVEEIQEAPESIIVKRKARPTGAKNKVKADTGGTPETPDPMYAALMKRLDDMELQKREEKPEKKPRPRKTAFKEPIVEEEYRPRETPSFQINGSPRTASRQLMEHLHFQQRERISARERMYEQFLPI